MKEGIATDVMTIISKDNKLIKVGNWFLLELGLATSVGRRRVT
jgi:hypothetical protein